MESVRARLHVGLREKLFLLLALPIVLAIGVITFVSSNALAAAIDKQYQDKAQAIVDGFNADIISLDLTTAHLQSEIDTYVKLDPSVLKISVYAPLDSKIVRVASTSREQLGTEADAEDLEPFRTNKTHRYESTANGVGYVEVVTPIYHEGQTEPMGVVGVYMNLTPRNEAISSQRLVLAGVGALGTLSLLSLLYWSLSKLILKPITRLAKATDKVTKGDYEAKVTVASTDELGELARSVNHMTDSLALQKGQLDERLKELELTNRKLAELDLTKSEFLAMVGRELKDPINSVIGCSELLIDHALGPLTERQMRYAQTIHASGRHLLQLTSKVVDLSLVDSGKMELLIGEFSVCSIVEEVESTLRPLIAKKRLSLVAEIDESVSAIEADARRFTQIMLNLVGSAVQSTPERGRITVSIGQVGDYLSVSVANTGISAAKQDQEGTPEELPLAEASTARQYEGTDLSLALTKRLIEMHGGQIWEESEPDEGRTFAFAIPAHPKVEQRPPVPSYRESLTGLSVDELSRAAGDDQPLILLVEGDRGTSDLFSGWLSDAGYRVARAFDGDQALRLAYELEPFAIALDLMLPKKDGWQVLRDLKALPDTRDIPVVIISALDVGNKGFSLGFVDYFTKPIDRNRLLDRLAKLGLTDTARRRPASILVVDDRPEAVELLTEILQAQGARIIKAYGGRQAIKSAIEELPDLVILDLNMPEVNGFDVVAELKKHPSARQIPIIVLTAKDLSSEDIRKLEGDVESIIQKRSFAREELLAEIAKLGAIYPEKARLTDPSTDLLTFAGFRRRLSQVIGTATRYDTPVALIHLRACLSQVGAEEETAGFPPDISAELARLLKSALKPDELAADLGEGNFAVILPHVEKRIASARVKELLRAWAGYRHQPGGMGQPVFPRERLATAVAVVSYPVDADSAEQLILKAREHVAAQATLPR